jgi:hypothetical protein
MDQALTILETAFAKAFGNLLGAVAVFGALFLLVVLLSVPVWFVLKRRVSARVDLRFGEAPGEGLQFHDTPPAAGEGARSDPEEFVARLDAVDRVATSLYEVLMYVAIAGMTALAVFFYLVIPADGNRDFLLLYGGVVYLIGMLWGTSQLYAIRRRRAGEPARSIRSALSQLGAKIEFNVETADPQLFRLDEAALERAAQHIAAGGTIDEACALVVPRYAGMNGLMKGILRKAVEAALAARPE